MNISISLKGNKPNKILNLLLYLFPVSFILGNLAVNINIILLISCTFLFFKDEIIKLAYSLNDNLIILIFFYILLVCIISLIKINFFIDFKIDHFKNSNFYLISKSIFYLRFLFLYFTLKFLIKKKIINFKYFFLICSILSIFISLDILLQFIYGKNIFGIEPISQRKLSGVFGSELIAGSYLQKFYIFFFPLILVYYPSDRNYISIFFYIILIFFAIILSGNRMPLVLGIATLILFSIYKTSIRIYLIKSFIGFLLIFSILFKTNIEVQNNFSSFKSDIIKIFTLIDKDEIKRKNMPNHFHEFESFYDTWKMNKFFGGGVKSFRIFCPYRGNISIGKKLYCNSHPHNYYLEILSELGLIGFILIVILFSNLVLKSIKKIIIPSYNNQSSNRYIFLTFFVLFLVEIFPLKSTGSFFSTGNSTYFFLLMAFIENFYNNNQKKHI